MTDKTHGEITVATRRASVRLEVNPPILVDDEFSPPCFVAVIEAQFKETDANNTPFESSRVEVGGQGMKKDHTPSRRWASITWYGPGIDGAPQWIRDAINKFAPTTGGDNRPMQVTPTTTGDRQE